MYFCKFNKELFDSHVIYFWKCPQIPILEAIYYTIFGYIPSLSDQIFYIAVGKYFYL